MPLKIADPGIDVGIVAHDATSMLSFYRDLLGLKEETAIVMPGGGVMNRLRAGDSLVKILVFNQPPPSNGTPGGIKGTSGLRYLTIHVSNLNETTRTIAMAGHTIVVDCKTLREGVAISIIEDPDGNYLELVEYD
jgi:predicted enzyme related to lactoylglutathione lyase